MAPIAAQRSIEGGIINLEPAVTIAIADKSEKVATEALSTQQSHGIWRVAVVSSSRSVTSFKEVQQVDDDSSFQESGGVSLRKTRLQSAALDSSSGASQSNDDGKENASQQNESLLVRHVSPCPSVASQASTLSNNPRQRFLFFVKILFKCLKEANEPEVLEKATKIVTECTRKNRQGDPQFAPLMEAVEKRIRGHVGEAIWRRSILLLRHYMLKMISAATNNEDRPPPKKIEAQLE